VIVEYGRPPGYGHGVLRMDTMNLTSSAKRTPRKNQVIQKLFRTNTAESTVRASEAALDGREGVFHPVSLEKVSGRASREWRHFSHGIMSTYLPP